MCIRDRYLSDDDVDIELDGRVKLNQKLGLITTVEESRRMLEEIYKINIES